MKITKQLSQDFIDRCNNSQAHDFLLFLTEPDVDNVSILDLISQVNAVLKFKPSKHDKDISLNEKIISNYMNEFFSIYMPQKAEEVKQILNKTHPFFIDSQGGTHINFIQVQQGDAHSSSVGHSGRKSFLEFNVYIHNTLDDLRTTAHELSHALSSHHQHLIEMLRANAATKEIDNYTAKRFEKDCIGEIESYITERLFNKFLATKDIFSKQDFDNYENQQQALLISEINLIKEERDVIKKLSNPVTFKSLNNLIKTLQKENNQKLLQRIEKMYNEKDKTSSYMFRYVVGRIVADQWINKFNNLHSNKKRKVMLNNFQEYLGKTHELDLNSACEFLLNKNFTNIVEDYVTDKINQTKANFLLKH